jgi:hypothetical protein
MGARTTWELKQNGQTLSLYSHWGGESKLADTKRALRAAKPRWSDDSYALRIFISQIVGNDWDSELGFGLGLGYDFEEEFTPAEINFDTLKITWGELTFTFDEFLAVSE